MSRPGSVILRIGRDVWPDDLPEKFQNLARLRVTSLDCLLREDQLVVYPELKRPFCAGNEGERLDDVLIIGKNFSRHTDGSFCVVSRNAVFKGDAVLVGHRVPPHDGPIFDKGQV